MFGRGLLVQGHPDAKSMMDFAERQVIATISFYVVFRIILRILLQITERFLLSIPTGMKQFGFLRDIRGHVENTGLRTQLMAT